MTANNQLILFDPEIKDLPSLERQPKNIPDDGSIKQKLIKSATQKAFEEYQQRLQDRNDGKIDDINVIDFKAYPLTSAGVAMATKLKDKVKILAGKLTGSSKAKDTTKKDFWLKPSDNEEPENDGSTGNQSRRNRTAKGKPTGASRRRRKKSRGKRKRG